MFGVETGRGGYAVSPFRPSTTPFTPALTARRKLRGRRTSRTFIFHHLITLRTISHAGESVGHTMKLRQLIGPALSA